MLINEGGQVTFEVVLTSQPQDKVFVPFNGAEGLAFNKEFVEFTATNWDQPQTITATAVGADR